MYVNVGKCFNSIFKSIGKSLIVSNRKYSYKGVSYYLKGNILL